jgi:hypothetical protein
MAHDDGRAGRAATGNDSFNSGRGSVAEAGSSVVLPPIEKKYGRSIAEWQRVIAGCGPVMRRILRPAP